MLNEGAPQIPQLADQLGVDIVTLRVFGPDHIILAVVEADDIESVREFILQSRLIQWNTTNIHPTYARADSRQDRAADHKRVTAELNAGSPYPDPRTGVVHVALRVPERCVILGLRGRGGVPRADEDLVLSGREVRP